MATRANCYIARHSQPRCKPRIISALRYLRLELHPAHSLIPRFPNWLLYKQSLKNKPFLTAIFACLGHFLYIACIKNGFIEAFIALFAWPITC